MSAVVRRSTTPAFAIAALIAFLRPATGGVTSCADCGVGSLECGQLAVRELGNGCEPDDGVFLDAWPIEIDAAGFYELSVRSEAFDPILFLTDDSCTELDASTRCGESGDSACIRGELEPGSYVVLVANSDPGVRGAYELSLECEPNVDPCAICPSQALECGESIEGTLSLEDCRLPDGESFDRYRVVLPEAGSVQFELRSAEFDPFLVLIGADCEPIDAATRPDADAGFPAALELPLSAGTYDVLVSSFTPLQTGAYSLTVDCGGGGFVRGDTNGDSAIDLADALVILNSLFQVDTIVVCASSLDANDDGAIGVSDALFLLFHLYRQGPAPPSPGRACGPDPTPDGLSCVTSGSCA